MHRIACRAVFLDAGGVIVLPDRHLLAGALARAGIVIDPDDVPQAHYRAVRALDRTGSVIGPDDVPQADYRAVRAPDHTGSALDPDDVPQAHCRAGRALDHAGSAAHATPDYPAALFTQLRILPGRAAEAHRVWERLTDRRHSDHVLWSEPVPGARALIDRLRLAGIKTLVVTNSDGHAEENLRASGFSSLPVIDSSIVGATKPDPRIFQIALARAGVSAAEVVHVGDTLTTDIAGAHAAGITPIHLDPLRVCRARDHRHVRSLAGLWRHLRRHQPLP